MFVVVSIVDICYTDDGDLLICWQWQDLWMFVMLTEAVTGCLLC